ncbi:MAG TPA: hypothetical protein VMH24_04700 [Candidatus Sulfotelmatobacter sp.]|nr:hypothetical protein [Candidatus Sulfotelmatobacter sp.]
MTAAATVREPARGDATPFLLRVLRSPWAPVAVGFVAFLLYLPLASQVQRDRPDFFYLADAFLHGRTWLEPASWLGPQDIVPIAGHVYVPFGPFPALLFMPVVAVFGPAALASVEFVINAALAGLCVGLAWRLIARFDSGRLGDRVFLVAFFGFGTDLWSVTVQGGVWHTGQLIAIGSLLLALLEATGRRRPLVMGLLVGAAFLSRAPILLAVPFFAAVAVFRDGRRWPSLAWRPVVRDGVLLAAGLVPFLAFFAWYNAVRFGSPFESGYGLATLTEPVLIAERAQGLFALVHVPQNLQYLLWELPVAAPIPLFLRPDGYGFPLLLQSPALLLGLRARWRDPVVLGAGLTALAVLVPSLLYYGGGFYQFGFRYLLDSMPFLLILVASGARTPLNRWWKVLIVAGIFVNAWGVTFSG